MSYRVTVEIVCDAPGCRVVLRQERINAGGLSKTWAAYKARAAGWRVKGRTGQTDPAVAFCPAHAVRP